MDRSPLPGTTSLHIVPTSSQVRGVRKQCVPTGTFVDDVKCGKYSRLLVVAGVTAEHCNRLIVRRTCICWCRNIEIHLETEYSAFAPTFAKRIHGKGAYRKADCDPNGNLNCRVPSIQDCRPWISHICLIIDPAQWFCKLVCTCDSADKTA